MSSRFILPKADVGSGIKPSDGAKLFFSENGLPFSTNPKNTFTDNTDATPNANPVIADSKGVFPNIYISGSYRIVLKDKNDVQIDQEDDIDELTTVSSAAFPKNRLTLVAAAADTGLVVDDALNIKEITTGSGGGGMWDVVLTSSVTPNTYNIVIGTGNALLSLVSRDDGVINLKKWGAKGDGSTNDNTAVQHALDWAKDNGISIYVPNGEYILTGITYKPSSGQRPINIRGEGALRAGEPENNLARARTRGVIFHFSAIAGSTVAFGIGDGTNNPQGVYMENIYILGQNSQNIASPTDTTIGLKLDNAPESGFRNVHCSKFNTAWELEDSHSCTLYSCSGVRSYIPIRGTTGFNAVKFYSWKSHTCYWAGETTASSAGVAFYGPWFENLTNGFLVNNGSSVVNGLSFHDPHCETITNYCFELGFDRSRSETAGAITSVHVYGGYYDSVGSGVSGSKFNISAATSRDVLIYGEPGNFDVGQIDGNMEPVKIIRSERTDQRNDGGPFSQEFYGYATGITDESATAVMTITVPTGDVVFQADISSCVTTSANSHVAMVQGVIVIGRKASGTVFATYSESKAKVAADNGGDSYAGTVTHSIAIVTNVITVSIFANTSSSADSIAMTHVKTLGGERSQSSVRKLAFASL